MSPSRWHPGGVKGLPGGKFMGPIFIVLVDCNDAVYVLRSGHGATYALLCFADSSSQESLRLKISEVNYGDILK